MMDDETYKEVIERKEMQVVPEGVSCTETGMSYFIRVREGNKFVRIRVLKESLKTEFDLVDFKEE